MKNRNFLKYPIIVLGLFVFWPSAPSSAAEGQHSVGLMVGEVWPSGIIGQNVDSAVAPGLSYEYSASDVFSVYLNSIRSSHTNDSTRIWSNSVGIKSNLFYIDKLAPYAMLGAGLYFVKKTIGIETAYKTNFGVHLGLGADLDVSERVFLGLEFDVHNLFASHVMLPIAGKQEISGRWAGFFLRGGIRF